MSEVAIKIENLWKQYRIGLKKTTSLRESLNQLFRRETNNYFWALQDLNFEIRRGEAVGIIGKNGAGKSTLLKILSKITYPTKGRIELDGRVSSLLEVGTGFHPELTGRQNVFLNGTILGMTRKEVASKFDEIVAFSGVEKFIDTPVKHYSSGMKVRLAFSVAAHLEPEILIVDEVLAVGDAEFQKKCLGKMGAVANEGRTVLFVSHNMAAIEILCDRGVLLKDGCVDVVGTQKDVISHYLIDNQRKSMNDIKLREDRKGQGEGEITVNSIVIRDDSGNSINQVRTGQSFSINFNYNGLEQNNRPRITIHIKDSQGNDLFMLHNRMSGNHFKNIPSSGAFSCNMNRLPLPPSEYYISYSIVQDGVIVDGLDYAQALEVISGDYYGSGEVPSVHQCKVLLDAEWSLSLYAD